jgi:hypothetical protein
MIEELCMALSTTRNSNSEKNQHTCSFKKKNQNLSPRQHKQLKQDTSIQRHSFNIKIHTH